MKLTKALKVISVLAVLGIVFGTISLQFKPTRQILIQIASIYPLSAIINRLQHYGIPSNNAECLEDLKQQNVSFKEQSNFSNSSGCKVEYAVRLARVGDVSLDNVPLLTCRMAMQLSKFEQDYLQPKAESLLGSYSCHGSGQWRFGSCLGCHGYGKTAWTGYQ